MSTRGSVRWGWLITAAAVGVAAIALAGTWRGDCFDAAEAGASSCTSGPLLGVPATWIMVGIAVVFIAVALVRAFTGARRRETVARQRTSAPR